MHFFKNLKSFILDWGQWSECDEGCGHRGSRDRFCTEDNNNQTVADEKCSTGNHTGPCFNDQTPCFSNENFEFFNFLIMNKYYVQR